MRSEKNLYLNENVLFKNKSENSSEESENSLIIEHFIDKYSLHLAYFFKPKLNLITAL